MGINQSTSLQEVKTENATEYKLSAVPSEQEEGGPPATIHTQKTSSELHMKIAFSGLIALLQSHFDQATFCYPLNILTAISRTTEAVRASGKCGSTDPTEPVLCCTLQVQA